ncbi:MAG: serine protease [Bacteroidales bacterium]
MFTKVWKSVYASVCQLKFINERGVTIDSLTGFKVNKHLVTSQHAFCIKKAHKVEITFVDADANTVTASTKIPYVEFINQHRIGVAEDAGHHAIFDIDLQEFEKIPSLKLSESHSYNIGSQVAFLSYSCGYSNLAIKTGIISSVYSNADGLRFIQFDGPVGCGNSGAPLIDPQTNEVLGIVTRRNTPAAKVHEQLMQIVSDNLVELKKVESSVKFGDIDPIQVLIANQNQLKHLAKIIYRHSTHSVSHAVTLDRIVSFFGHNTPLIDVGIPLVKNNELDSFIG